jgi:hypothetical protein
MKNILYILLLFSLPVMATDYYFSNSGNDDGAGTIGDPWASATKLQLTINGSSPGDNFYFAAGSVWNDTIIVIDSKSTLTFNKYGTGANPKFHCYYDISGSWSETSDLWSKYLGTRTEWADHKWVEYTGPTNGNYIWNYLNWLLIDGEPYAIGKYPNTGYIHFDDINENHTTWTDYNSSWTTNQWAGAVISAVPCNQMFVLDRAGIYGNSSNSLSVNSSQFFSSVFNDFCTTYAPQEAFIINDADANTEDGDWCFKHETGIMTIRWSGALNSSKIEIPRYNFAWEIKNSDHITFNNIDFDGGIIHTIRCDESDYVTFDGCNISKTPVAGIWAYDCDEFTVQNCTITKGCNMGIALMATYKATIQNNHITYIGIDPAMGGDRFMTSYFGIWVENRYDGVSILSNFFDSTGYSAIGVKQTESLTAQDMIIEDNIIYDWNQLLSDGGAIYINDSVGGLSGKERRIKRNIMSSYTNNTDIQSKTPLIDVGIYLDCFTSGFVVDSNTIFGGTTGIYGHPAVRDTFRYNNIYQSGMNDEPMFPAGWTTGSGVYSHYGYGEPSYLYFQHNNIVVTEPDNYNVLLQYDYTLEIPNCEFDYNKYYNPFLDAGGKLFARMQWYNITESNTWSLSQYQTISGQESHSTANENGMNYFYSPLEPEQLIKLIVNLSEDSIRVVNLYDLEFEDVSGNVITTADTLQPKQSKFLFRNENVGTTANMDLINQLDWGNLVLGETPYTPPSEATDTIGKINFTYSTFTQSGWTNLSTWGTTTELANDVTITTPSGGYTGYNGEPTGIWPNNVMYYRWHLETFQNSKYYFTLSNLDTSRYTQILIMSSRDNLDASPPRTNYFSVGIDSTAVEPVGNTSTLVEFDSLETTSGTIQVGWSKLTGNYGYINGMVIIQFPKVGKDTLIATDTILVTDFDNYYFGISDINEYLEYRDFPDREGDDDTVLYHPLDGYYTEFDNVDFSSVNYIVVHCLPTNPGDTIFEFRVDSVDGQLIGIVLQDEFTETFVNLYGEISISDSIHDLYVINRQAYSGWSSILFYEVIPKNWGRLEGWELINWRF